MDPPVKGTVTPFTSWFSADEALKAASYVEEKIGEKRSEMNRLHKFVDENDNLINLVKKLPDQLHHNVMVPFGKIAFFPGRLIHTNECLVLLGENYYTDRTSKQTVDILKRRDKTLQSQIHSLKAEIKDFQTEASFFSTSATEAAEGIVEIREDYAEEDSSATAVIQSGEKESSGVPGGETAEGEVEDDEFARIMSRLNELEIEEEQEGEEHDCPTVSVKYKEHDRITGKEATITLPKVSGHSSSIDEPRYSEPRVKSKVIEVLPEKHSHKDLDDPLKCIGLKTQYLHKEDKSFGGLPQKNAGTWRDFQATSAVEKANVVGPQKTESPIQKLEPKFDSNKAFTGSIVEHPQTLETNTQSQMQSSESQPSKPVSRFKAQRK